MELKQVDILESTVVTASGETRPFGHHQGLSGIFTFTITAAGGTTPSIIFKLQAQEPQTGNWYDVTDAALASISANGTYVLAVDPSITAVAGTNAKVSNLLPGTLRIAYTVGGTTPTFTVVISGELY